MGGRRKRNIKSIDSSNNSDQLKSTIIKTRNIIRKKFRNLHQGKLDLNREVNETYKPIIEPLETIVKYTKIKQEKNEYLPIKKEEEPRVRFSPSVYQTARATLKKKRPNLFYSPNVPPPVLSTPSTSQSNSHNISGISSLHNEDDSDEDDPSMFSEAQSDMPSNEYETSSLEESIQKHVRRIKAGMPYTFGLTETEQGLTLGKSAVKVQKTPAGEYYSIKKKQFPITPGLSDLLLMNHPTKYTEKDLDNYKEMLVYTNAHKKGFSKSGDIVRDVTIPKHSIITRLFPPLANPRRPLRGSASKEKKTGTSLKRKIQTNFKRVNKRGADYVYWDDPNELVDRLRLLMASQISGHTGHNNEIISIIEELREANLIK